MGGKKVNVILSAKFSTLEKGGGREKIKFLNAKNEPIHELIVSTENSN